jgi:dTDP-glucose 4,6-dehydratase
MIADKAVLVTGGAGFIGSHYVHALVKLNAVCVINLDALTATSNLERLTDIDQDPAHHFVLGSIGDRSLVDYLLGRYQPCAVVNFAAFTGGSPAESPDQFVRTNVLGTYELLEATRKYWNSLSGGTREEFRFVQISSDKVYGSLDGEGRFSEQSPDRPNSLYAASKSSSDHLVRCFYQANGMPVLTLRLSNVYGPWQFPEKLIPMTVSHAVQGERIPVYGQGEQVRDWLYVDDCCRAIDQVLEYGRPGEVYNTGGGNERSSVAIVTEACAILDEIGRDAATSPHAALIEFVEDPTGRDFAYRMDCSKIERETGWLPQVPLASGIRTTVHWYLKNQHWCGKYFEAFDSVENKTPESGSGE